MVMESWSMMVLSWGGIAARSCGVRYGASSANARSASRDSESIASMRPLTVADQNPDSARI